MHGTKERRFKTYNAMEIALRKSGMQKPGAVSTLLLEAFLEDGGRLPASKSVARGVCKEGEFGQWRKALIEKGWLQWSESQQDKGQYFPGKKLMPYVNKEIIAQKEIATRESVEQVRAEKADRSELEVTRQRLEATNRALAEIAESVREIQEALIPPDTPEKKRARERALDRISARAAAN